MGIMVKELCEVMGVKRVEREEKFMKSLGRGRLMCSDYRCWGWRGQDSRVLGMEGMRSKLWRSRNGDGQMVWESW